jgi:putative zinc finger/helix-turn-helix YgiT family protein
VLDAGGCSLANATSTIERGLDDLLCLRDNQSKLLKATERVLGCRKLETAGAVSYDLDGDEVVIRRLWRTSSLAGWLDWTLRRTALRLHATQSDETCGDGLAVPGAHGQDVACGAIPHRELRCCRDRLETEMTESKSNLCPICQEPALVTRRASHHYVESGLMNITLDQLEVSECGHCGERIISIPRLAELHRAIAFALVQQPSPLIGSQIRFLRKYLGWSGVDFAAVMGTAPETVSRWEHGKQSMTLVADRLLRALVLRQRPVEEYPNERLAPLGRAVAGPQALSAHLDARGNWLAQAA